MKIDKLKQIRRKRRKIGIRKRVLGTPERPRLSVHRSNKHIYAQVIDDLAGRTLAATDSRKSSSPANKAAAAEVGKALAQNAKAASITKVVFDRSGFKYHGRVKAMAEAAREGGLQF